MNIAERHMTTGATRNVRLRRGFGWGILVVLNNPNGEVPDLKGKPFAASSSGLVIVVRHAQDVDATVLDPLASNDYVPEAQVAVHVLVASHGLESADYQSVLSVTDGNLDIGDADRWDSLHLPVGSWQAQVTASPADAPDHIEIVLSPAHPEAHTALDARESR